mmetsp:Transcript_38439/g.85608  ORF Transcript_38439/g.85608 Transcript_38439/m.85608 type:complete len:322 (+) Transcript_38439:1235-2200(+)
MSQKESVCIAMRGVRLRVGAVSDSASMPLSNSLAISISPESSWPPARTASPSTWHLPGGVTPGTLPSWLLLRCRCLGTARGEGVAADAPAPAPSSPLLESAPLPCTLLRRESSGSEAPSTELLRVSTDLRPASFLRCCCSPPAEPPPAAPPRTCSCACMRRRCRRGCVHGPALMGTSNSVESNSRSVMVAILRAPPPKWCWAFQMALTMPNTTSTATRAYIAVKRACLEYLGALWWWLCGGLRPVWTAIWSGAPGRPGAAVMPVPGPAPAAPPCPSAARTSGSWNSWGTLLMKTDSARVRPPGMRARNSTKRTVSGWKPAT